MRTAIVFMVAALAVACGGVPETDVDAHAAPAEPAAPTAAELERVSAILATADAADGETDHVVGKCAGCALAMEGDADYALEVDGYTMHFCSDHCRDGFADDTQQKLLAMQLLEPSE